MSEIKSFRKTTINIVPIGNLKSNGTNTLAHLKEPYQDGLKYLDRFSHAILFFESNNTGTSKTSTKTRQTETPYNRLNIRVARILKVEETEGHITFEGIEAGDRANLYDIKPYFPCEDRVEQYQVPDDLQNLSEWWEKAGENEHLASIIDGPEISGIDTSEQLEITGQLRKKDGQTFIELLAQERELIKRLSGFSHVKILWWFHRFDKSQYRRVTQVEPPYENAPRTGVFATRSPVRPNPLALTTARLLDINEERQTIHLSGIDAFDRTPVIAVQPYIPTRDRVMKFFVPDWLKHWPEWLDDRTADSACQIDTITDSAIERMVDLKLLDTIPEKNKTDALRETVSIDETCLDHIKVKGCRQNNLKNISFTIPKNKLTVVTGISGSGKSSLAFDTVYAESRRRFMDSMAGAAAGLGQIEKPDVDQISGLPPAIAIEQKNWGRNPRSTVGTLTDIHDYLRLLFATIGIRHCPECGSAITPMKSEQIINTIEKLQPGTPFSIRPFDHEEPQSSYTIPENDHKSHSEFHKNLSTSISHMLEEGNGAIILTIAQSDEFLLQTKEFCHHCNRVFFHLSSATFSFNNPESMCPVCKGLGKKLEIDSGRIISNPELSILDGASKWWGNLRKFREKPNANWMKGEVLGLAQEMEVNLELAWRDLPEEFKQQALFGSNGRKVSFTYENKGGRKGEITRPVEGVYHIINRLFKEQNGNTATRLAAEFMREKPCTVCQGERLLPEGRLVTICGTRFPETVEMTLEQLRQWINELPGRLADEQFEIALPILKQMNSKLKSLIEAGVSYLSLDRPVPTLSGGELQRLRLATQLGSGISNILYVLDEPSTGLHPRDHHKLINLLQRLKNNGNTVLVVEHDSETMLAADKIIDIGPGAGVHGGKIIAQGTPADIMKQPDSMTGKFLSSHNNYYPIQTRKKAQNHLVLKGAACNNLKNIDTTFPLGVLCCITGVSGSGKSSLVSKTLYPALSLAFGEAVEIPGEYESIEGIEAVDSIISISQHPIGRTPRSNPATYTGVFDHIRSLYAATPEAKARQYQQNKFSFNSKEGQCPTCSGEGRIRYDMAFMPDLWVECSTCHGSRFKQEILEINWHGKNIAEVLDMNVEEALAFFKGETKITAILQTLSDVGLGYIRLGQSAVTLSGGEAQRIKLAKELCKTGSGKTIYLLDEPTTGLHFSDIQNLLNILHRLTESGNSVLVIEHNPDFLLHADWIIDLGPEGGDGGGTIIAQGTPEDVAAVQESHTGNILMNYLSV